MTNNQALKKLRAGEIVRMVNISRVTEPWLAEVAGRVGFDLIWLDLEHRTFGADVIAPMALACRASGADLMVRIRKTDYSSPMTALESGAGAILVPHCQNGEEAERWVQWCRFPPLGRRGFDGAGADADYMVSDAREYMAHANRESLLAVQIEDPEAVECVEEIAAVDGIDLLFIGPGDLSIGYGVPMQLDHPLLRAAIKRVSRAAQAAGKWWGMATSDPSIAQDVVNQGARLITCGSDQGWLLQGINDALHRFDKVGIPAEQQV